MLWQIRFFCPATLPMGILEMDFESIGSVPFFHSSSRPIMLCVVIDLPLVPALRSFHKSRFAIRNGKKVHYRLLVWGIGDI